MSCALGYTASIGGCASCKFRTPLVSLVMPEPAPQPRIRGFGDLVQATIRVLFLGRLDIAERLAGRVEALWSRRRREASVSLSTTPRRPCGCKARQRALNDLLPFGK
jgi:hypothetical protein